MKGFYDSLVSIDEITIIILVLRDDFDLKWTKTHITMKMPRIIKIKRPWSSIKIISKGKTAKTSSCLSYKNYITFHKCNYNQYYYDCNYELGLPIPEAKKASNLSTLGHRLWGASKHSFM